MRDWLVHWLLKSHRIRQSKKGYGYSLTFSTTGNCARLGAAGRVAARERGVASGRSSHVSTGHGSGNGLRAVVASVRRLDFGGGNHRAGGNHLRRKDH